MSIVGSGLSRSRWLADGFSVSLCSSLQEVLTCCRLWTFVGKYSSHYLECACGSAGMFACPAAVRSAAHVCLSPVLCWGLQVQPYEPMHPGCSLVARKFDLSALDAMMRLGADCEAGFAWSSFCYQP